VVRSQIETTRTPTPFLLAVMRAGKGSWFAYESVADETAGLLCLQVWEGEIPPKWHPQLGVEGSERIPFIASRTYVLAGKVNLDTGLIEPYHLQDDP